MKNKVTVSPSNASPTPSMVYSTRSHHQRLQEEPQEDAPVEEPTEVEPEPLPDFSNVQLRLNTDRDLDLVGKRECDIRWMVTSRSYVPTRTYDPDFLSKIGMDTEFASIFHAIG